MMRRLPAFLSIAIVAAVGSLFVFNGNAADSPQVAEEEPVPVVLRDVQRVERAAWVALSGDIVARRTVNVGFMVPGLVRTVTVDEGDYVPEGRVLAELDPTDYRLNLELARAQRERAEDEHRRAATMFEQKAVAPNDFHKAETALRQARAQEALAEKKLTDARLRAPMSGIVARRGVQPGEQVGPGVPVFTLVDVDVVQVRVGVPEAEIGRIAVGQGVQVTIPSLQGASFEGTVSLVGVAADPASRTYTAKVEVDNAEGVLKPGMIAEVRITTSEEVVALTVPGEAVVRDAQGVTRVFVYDPEEERVYGRRVDVGSVYGQEVEITAGLSGGERVVVGGQHRVREGSRVSTGGVAAAGVEG